MKYLSIDIEATGLKPHDQIIEFAAVFFDTEKPAECIKENLSFHTYVKCPSFEDLKSKLDPWVVEHNETLIKKAHHEGCTLLEFKEKFDTFLNSKEYKNFFENEKRVILFGKSLNAIDLPFLTRDLSWDFMQKYFSHRVLDLSCVAYSLIDMGILPAHCQSGSGLMKFLQMGEVSHTALEDAQNTAIMYLKLIKKIKPNSSL